MLASFPLGGTPSSKEGDLWASRSSGDGATAGAALMPSADAACLLVTTILYNNGNNKKNNENNA
jgi:hypothetical protein